MFKPKLVGRLVLSHQSLEGLSLDPDTERESNPPPQDVRSGSMLRCPSEFFFIHERLRQLGHEAEARHRRVKVGSKRRIRPKWNFFFVGWFFFFRQMFRLVSVCFGFWLVSYFSTVLKNPGEDLFEETEAAKNINEPIKKVTKIKRATIKLVEDENFLNPFPIKLLHQMWSQY